MTVMNNNFLSLSTARRALWTFACAALAASALLTVPAARAADEPKKQEISRVIAKEMTAAQKALQAQQWAEALKNLEVAETKSPLTTYDKKIIYQFEAIAYVRLNRLKDAQAAFEKEIGTGATTPDENQAALKALFSIAASSQQYQKTIEYGKQLVDSGTATPEQISIIAQSYYLLKDCKNSVAWADKAIAAERKAGSVPKENDFLFKLQCASDTGDQQAMVPVLQDLIRLNGKTQYWNDLLRIELQGERDDHNTLMIFRLMYVTKSMTDDSNLIEMVQLLADAGLPGEAYGILNNAITTGTVKAEHKERSQRLLNSLKTRSDNDQKTLPQQEADANKSATGDLLVKLGEVYYGFGDYQKAADAINQGLQKGGVKKPDEAYVYLALTDVQLKDTAGAKKAIAGLKTVPNVSPRVARIWELYGQTVGSGAAAAAASPQPAETPRRTAQIRPHRTVQQ
jgi:tetratricopeptide (TPR) repeat protein